MPMRRIVFSCALVCALVALGSQAVASIAAPSTTAAQLTKRFKAATGDKLVRNTQLSSPGRYVVYDLGVPTTAKKAKYGTFSIYLITSPDVDTTATDLLKNTRTGMLDPVSAGGIYWESGTSIYGQQYWQAKKRYGKNGKNVVVKWIGSSPMKKTDITWKRLHTALLKATK